MLVWPQALEVLHRGRERHGGGGSAAPAAAAAGGDRGGMQEMGQEGGGAAKRLSAEEVHSAVLRCVGWLGKASIHPLPPPQ